MTEVSVTTTADAIGLIMDARRQDPITHAFTGDLQQMGAQRAFITQHGIKVGVNGGIPGVFSEDDWKKSLALIWERKIAGWWQYERDFRKYGICTAEEISEARSRMYNERRPENT